MEKGSGVVIMVGVPRKGEPPRFQGAGSQEPARKGGDPAVGTPVGSPDLSDAGFWDHTNPHVCERCEHFSKNKCGHFPEVDFEVSDASFSGCNEWEGKEEDEEEDEEEEKR